MPVPFIALLAATLHQARSTPDGAATTHGISLLIRATGGAPVTIERTGPRLLVNGLLLDAKAPGASQITEMLVVRELHRVEIPANVDVSHWQALIQLFAAAPGLYPTTAHLRSALQTIVPAAVLVGDEEAPNAEGTSGSSHDLGRTVSPVAVGSARDERAALSAQLDPVIARGRDALAREDSTLLAEVVLELRAMERGVSERVVLAISAERHRLATPEVLAGLARQLSNPDHPPAISRLFVALGAEGASILVEQLAHATTRLQRRAYIDLLTEIPESVDAVLVALRSKDPQLLSDAAEIAGHGALERAIPALTVLIRDANESVRTAAWHALEQIGTPSAMAALDR